ncbi:MAG: hypothetical protein CMJ81_01005 [Planctomycetaceae bacterium]|nr:hypothetical protein [Planctomycetaceae bacterium]
MFKLLTEIGTPLAPAVVNSRLPLRCPPGDPRFGMVGGSPDRQPSPQPRQRGGRQPLLAE